MKTSLISSSVPNQNVLSEARHANNGAQANYFNVENGLNSKPYTNSQYESHNNKMSKRITPKQGKDSNISKENWNSLYSDVECPSNLPSNRAFYDIPSDKTNYEPTVEKFALSDRTNNLNFESTNHPIGIDSSNIKVPWQEYESSNSNVVDITQWIMNTLGSAIKLRFLDLAGLETYISQIVLLIKLITTTSCLLYTSDAADE